MRKEYHYEIVNILLSKGSDGASAHDVARYIYNQHCSLFDHNVVFKEIHQFVRQHLWRQSQQKQSPFLHIGRGKYAIKPDFFIQLDFLDELYWGLEDKYVTPPTLPTEQTEESANRQLLLF